MYIYKKLFKVDNKIYRLTQDKVNSRYSDIVREDFKTKEEEFVAEIDNKKSTIKYEIEIDNNLKESIKKSNNIK